MNEHKKINAMLVEYALGELSQQQVSQVQKHLTQCSLCSEELKRIMVLIECTEKIQRTTIDEQACASTMQAILRAIQNQETEQHPGLSFISLEYIRKNIMKSPIIKTAAVIVLIIFFVGLNYFSINTGNAYGMSDVLNLLYTADSVHIRGKMYFPEAPDIKPVDIEYWVDIAKGRWRKTNVTSIYNAEGIEISVSEGVCDGNDYEMTIDHINKNVSFTKMSRFMHDISIRQTVGAIMNLIKGPTEAFDEFTEMSEENINGQIYQVWEMEISQLVNKIDYRIQSRLSPETGDVVEVIVWTKEDGRDWMEKMQLYLIERNIPIADDIFDLQIPTGYISTNTKETARFKPIGALACGAGDYLLSVHLLFVLPDGSLILCWSSDNTKIQTSKQELFKDLKVGGNFPKLPFQVDALEVSSKNKKVTYTGHHLAYTQKQDKFYEWGIYTSSKRIAPEYAHLLIFNLVYSDNIDNPKIANRSRLGKSADMWIRNNEDFDEIFMAAIEEMSDKPNIESNLSYQSIIQFVKDLSK